MTVDRPVKFPNSGLLSVFITWAGSYGISIDCRPTDPQSGEDHDQQQEPTTVVSRSVWQSVVLLALVLLPVTNQGQERRVAPQAIDGILDLRDWRFEGDSGVTLSGDWRFAWNRLISPGGTPPAAGDALITVPSRWNDQVVDGTELSPFGYATYQLTLHLPPGRPSLHLDLPEINMAFSLWANGERLTGAGTVATSAENEVPRSVPLTVELPDADEIHLVMHVSNYYHFEGGIPRQIKLDRSDTVTGSWQRRLLMNVFTIGALCFLGLHYLVLYLNRREEPEHLLYALLAFLFLLRLVVVNQLTYLFIDHPHIISTRLSYTTIFLVPPIYLLFLNSLFPQEVSRKFAMLMLAVGAACTAVTYFTPAHVFTLARDTWILVIQGVVVYATACVAFACIRRREDAMIVLGIVMVLGATIIYDTLLYQRVMYANDISPYGFLVFIFGHAAILGRRANRAFRRESAARQELAELTGTLQSRVEDRTADLSAKVAELEQQEAELEQARESAVLANSAKTRFLAAASHDLRQPLHALNLFVETLESSIRKGNWQRVVARISQSLGGLDKLLVDLSEVSRLESGLMTPIRDDVPLQPCFDRMRDEFEVLCAEKGLQLRVVGTSLCVDTDAEMLERILRNLLSNAVKYTPKGRILLGCRRTGDNVRIEVRDTGSGIEPGNQKLIFEEFYRLESSREIAPGVGLGLSIVRHLTQLLGHRVVLVSRPGVGTCFSVELPRAQSVVHRRGETPPVVPDVELDGTRVLFVDDDATIRDAMSDALKDWGCEVTCVGGVGGVRQCLEAGYSPDLLVTDYHLADGETALEVADATLEFRPSLPVLVITAEGSDDTLCGVRDRGYSMLFKPVNMTELRNTLATMILNTAHGASRLQ